MDSRLSHWLLDLVLSQEVKDQKVLEQAYYVTFTSDTGMVVLQDLVRNCYHTISFAPGDRSLTDFHEGRRAVIQQILAILERTRFPEKETGKAHISEDHDA